MNGIKNIKFIKWSNLIKLKIKKKIFYWAPFLTPIATPKAVINSAYSLQKYSNEFDCSIINFFGEFNIINNEIVYANQLKIVKRSKLEAVVKHSYFKGPYYLVEAVLDGNVLFFENQFKLEKNAIVYIDIFK